MIGGLTSIAAMVAVGLVLIAGSLAPLLLFFAMALRELVDDDRGPWRPRPWLWVASSVVAFASIVFAIYLMGHTGDNEASHCGSGTHYVEQNRLVGKTIVHDWVCVA